MTRYSDATLKRLIRLDCACVALCDYRSPGHMVTTEERNGLARYLDSDMTPADMAEAYQGANPS